MQTTPDCPCDLNGLKVLVTRPKEQAGALAEAIVDCGGQVELLPLLAIEPAATDADREKLRESFAPESVEIEEISAPSE